MQQVYIKMNFLIQYLIASGVPQETIVLLLILPVMATIIAFARQVIGIKGFGIYTPLIISFAFLATGLKIGLSFFIAIIVAGTVFRFLLKRLSLLYLPRMAIVLTGVGLTMLFVFWASSFWGFRGVLQVSIFALLIMITLVEKFIAAQIERGAKGAVILTIETLLLSIICYGVASWDWLQTFILNFPFWIIAIAILINLILGRWTGLRLYEYFRFREVIKRVELPKK